MSVTAKRPTRLMLGNGILQYTAYVCDGKPVPLFKSCISCGNKPVPKLESYLSRDDKFVPKLESCISLDDKFVSELESCLSCGGHSFKDNICEYCGNKYHIRRKEKNLNAA